MRNFAVPVILSCALALAACSEQGAPTDLDRGLDTSAHESNNRADLTGDGISGQAIVNFTGNSGNAWLSTVNLSGDLADGTYDFYVINEVTGAETLVCSFTLAGNGGRQGCSSDTNLGGFHLAEVRDGGTVVAEGRFERRGGNRFKG